MLAWPSSNKGLSAPSTSGISLNQDDSLAQNRPRQVSIARDRRGGGVVVWHRQELLRPASTGDPGHPKCEDGGEGGIFRRADGFWCASLTVGYAANGETNFD